MPDKNHNTDTPKDMQPDNNEEFERYRRQMHGQEDQGDTRPQTGRIMRLLFTILMVIVYIGMGILLLINFFGWDITYAWPRYTVGCVLIVYGIWRAYRHYAGIDSSL